MDEGEKRIWLTDDVIVGVGIIAFAVSIFAQVPGSYGDVMLFPKIAGVVSLVCGVLIVATSLLRPAGKIRGGFRAEAICLAVSAFMYLTMMAAERLGFFVCLFIVCFGVNQLIAVFCREKGIGTLVRSLALSAAMCGFTFLVFRILLGIITPAGLFV